MTITAGIRSGLRSGIRSGLNPGGDAMNGVTRDATSNVYLPATLGEWATARSAASLAAGAVTSIWKMQDASGGAADVTGTNNLTEFGTVSYRAAVTGWTAKALAIADGVAGAEFASTDASLPNIAATSVLLLAYVALPTAPGGTRTLIGLGSSSYEIRVSTTPAFTIFAGGNSAAGASNLGASVRPHVLRHNLTAGTAMYCTDQEKVAPTFDAAVTGKRVDFGGFNAAAANVQYVYAAMFTGAAAELSDAQVKALLQALGWSVAW